MPENRVIFITGASSGIGYATALEFAKRGYHVAGTARNADRLEPLQAQIAQQNSVTFLPLSVDVHDSDTVKHAIKQTVDHFGRLDVVIANAGIGQRGSVENSAWEDVENLLRTNIDGVLHTIRAALPYFREQGSGHIVTISSIVFNMIMPYAAYYAASKAFISSFAKSLRLELENDNITVTDMIVGRTNTNFNSNRLGGQRTVESIPVMSADEVATAIVNAVEQRRETVTVRWLDRIIVWGNVLIPKFIGRIAKKQYK